jgi:hypothetical protein
MLSSPLAWLDLQRVEHDRVQENARIDGVEVADDLADMLDLSVRAFDPGHVVQIVQRAVDVEIDAQRDRVGLDRRWHQAAEDLRIDQVIAHGQQERPSRYGLAFSTEVPLARSTRR